MTITIPFKPMPFQRPRFNGRTRAVFNSPIYSRYKAQVQQLLRLRWKKAPLKGPLSLICFFEFKEPKKTSRLYPRGDIDNCTKCLMDCGNGILWEDDDQIVTLAAEKYYGDIDATLFTFEQMRVPG